MSKGVGITGTHQLRQRGTKVCGRGKRARGTQEENRGGGLLGADAQERALCGRNEEGSDNAVVIGSMGVTKHMGG